MHGSCASSVTLVKLNPSQYSTVAHEMIVPGKACFVWLVNAGFARCSLNFILVHHIWPTCFVVSFFSSRWHLAASSKELRVAAIGAINRASIAAATARAQQLAPPQSSHPSVQKLEGRGVVTAAALLLNAADMQTSGPQQQTRRGSQTTTAAASMVGSLSVTLLFGFVARHVRNLDV